MAITVGSSQDRTPEGVLRTLHGEPTTLTLGTALGLLPALDLPPDVKEAAVAGLIERATDPAIVAAALRVLGRLGGAMSLEVLRATVRAAQDGRVVAEAALALAWAGDPGDVELLREATARFPSGFAVDRAVIGIWLLVHRHGLATELPPYPGDELEDLELVNGGEALAAATVDVLGPGLDRLIERGSWSLPDDPRVASGFICAGHAHAIITGRHTVLEEMARHPLLAAVVAGEAEESEVPILEYVVLTRPGQERDLDVLITTSTGELLLRGGGSLDAATARIELRAVSAPGAIAVEATIEVVHGADEGDTPTITVAGRSAGVATFTRTPLEA